MNHSALKDKFKAFCTTDNFSAPPYEVDTIVNFFTSEIAAREEVVRQETWDGLKRLPCHSHGGVSKEGKIPSAIKVEDIIEYFKFYGIQI